MVLLGRKTFKDDGCLSGRWKVEGGGQPTRLGNSKNERKKEKVLSHHPFTSLGLSIRERKESREPSTFNPNTPQYLIYKHTHTNKDDAKIKYFLSIIEKNKKIF